MLQLHLRCAGTGEFEGDIESVGGGGFYIGRDADFGPVIFRIGIDGFDFGNAHAEVIVETVEDASVGSTSGGFSDEHGALEHFEVVGELFGTRGGSRGSEDEDRLIGKIAAGNRRLRPGFGGGGFARVVPIFGMIEKVGADKLNRGGIAAAIVTEVEDDGVGVIDVGHGRHDCDAADFRIGKRIEFEIADVAGKEFHFFNGAILLLHSFAVASERFHGLRRGLLRKRRREVIEREMAVASGVAQFLGHDSGERGAIGDVVIFASLFAGEEEVGDFLAGGMVNVVLPEIFGCRGDDAFTFG